MISAIALVAPRSGAQGRAGAPDRGFAQLFGEAMAQPVSAALRPTFGADQADPDAARGDSAALLPTPSLAAMLASLAAVAKR